MSVAFLSFMRNVPFKVGSRSPYLTSYLKNIKSVGRIWSALLKAL